jgi:hypothetical protein
MKKNEINIKFREYARTLSPKIDERDLISKIYQSFNDLFGVNNCIQIGSYPRFTAITPVHDLDLLYFLGDWNESSHNPSTALQDLNSKINKEYKNPTKYKIDISLQTHSVTVLYLNNTEEIFSVDIVPAYFFSKNEFNDDTYKVPEIIRKKHGKNRFEFYQKLSQEHKDMNWITSDPRGYIKIASETDKITSGEFRKTVKIIKAWKNNLTNNDENLKLKSFHLEQIITKYFQDNNNIEIFDAIFKFFTEIPKIINNPNQIKDRANNDKFIDDYLQNFTDAQKEKITQARNCLLIKLERFSENDTIQKLLETCFYKRHGDNEQFLFDFNIPCLTESDYSFKICGEVQVRTGGFREYILDKIGLINIDRKIKFRISGAVPNVDLFKWKVKNDNNSEQPRGEITDHRTLRDPEETRYTGSHYVECYAILNNICVARAIQNVKLE